WPATTPSPMIAYCPDDGCFGTVLVPPYLQIHDSLLSSHNSPSVVPAKAGTHTPQPFERPVVMGPRLRGDDNGRVIGKTIRRVITQSSPFVRSFAQSTARPSQAPTAVSARRSQPRDPRTDRRAGDRTRQARTHTRCPASRRQNAAPVRTGADCRR